MHKKEGGRGGRLENGSVLSSAIPKALHMSPFALPPNIFHRSEDRHKR